MPRVSTTSQVQPVEKKPTRRRAVPKPSDDGHASTTPKKVAKKNGSSDSCQTQGSDQKIQLSQSRTS